MAITRQDIEALSPREQEGLYREDARTAMLVAKKLGTTPEEVLAAVRPDPISVMKGFVGAVAPGLRGEYAPADPNATSDFGRAMAGAPSAGQLLRGAMPGLSAVVQGSGEDIPEAYRQGGFGGAAGQLLRSTAAVPAAILDDTLLRPSREVAAAAPSMMSGPISFLKALLQGTGGGAAAAAEVKPRAGDIPEGKFQGDPAVILREIARIKDPAERAAAMEAFRRQMGGTLPSVPAASAPPVRTGPAAPLAASMSQSAPQAPQADSIDALSEYLKKFGDSQRALLAGTDSKKALEAIFAKAGERPSSTDLTGKALAQALLFAGLRAATGNGNMGPAMQDFTQTLGKGAERELLGKQDAYDTALKQALAVNTAGLSDADKRFALEQSLGGAGMKIPELRHTESRADKKAQDEYNKAIAVAKIQAGRGPQTLREQVLDIESLSPAQLEILKSLKGDKTDRKFDYKLYEDARTSLMEIKGITQSQADMLAGKVAAIGIEALPAAHQEAMAEIASKPKTGWFN